MMNKRAISQALSIVILVVIILAALLGYAVGVTTQRQSGAPLLATQGYSIGSNGLSDSGWLVSPHTLIWTSYITNQSVNSFLIGNVDLFPYHVPANASLDVGLYVNGVLKADAIYSNIAENNLNARMPQTQMVSQVSTNSAHFTNFTIGFLVWDHAGFPIKSGSTVSLAVIATQPLWLQVQSAVPNVGATPSFFCGWRNYSPQYIDNLRYFYSSSSSLSNHGCSLLFVSGVSRAMNEMSTAGTGSLTSNMSSRFVNIALMK